LGEKLLHLSASQLTPQHNFTRGINPMNLEHVLRQIQANHANLRHGRSPCWLRIITTSLALMMPSGAVHPIIRGNDHVVGLGYTTIEVAACSADK
jgi:hypothetical protein